MPKKTFKKGNKGRSKDIEEVIGKRRKLLNLFDDRAEDLIKKVIEMALAGDQQAMRMCVERLVPPAKRDLIDLKIPETLDEKGIKKVNERILKLTITGQIPSDEAERLMKLTSIHAAVLNATAPELPPGVDAIEASKIYQKIMGA